MKVGDQVKIIKTTYENEALQVGKTGRIVEKGFTYNGFEIRTDCGYADNTGDDLWSFYYHELEVIQ